MLLILAFLLSILGTDDFTSATFKYRNLNLGRPLSFKIEKKYNNVKRELFPDLKFYGIVLETNKGNEIGVSRGDFDNSNIGDTINIFKLKSADKYMTQYEINNQKFIKIFGNPVSFVIIPTFIAFVIGIITMFIIIRKFKLNSNGG